MLFIIGGLLAPPTRPIPSQAPPLSGAQL